MGKKETTLKSCYWPKVLFQSKALLGGRITEHLKQLSLGYETLHLQFFFNIVKLFIWATNSSIWCVGRQFEIHPQIACFMFIIEICNFSYDTVESIIYHLLAAGCSISFHTWQWWTPTRWSNNKNVNIFINDLVLYKCVFLFYGNFRFLSSTPFFIDFCQKLSDFEDSNGQLYM